MSDNLRSCASCTDELITFTAEHDDEQAMPSDATAPDFPIRGGSTASATARTEGTTSRRSGNNGRRKRFSRLRPSSAWMTEEERQQRDHYTKEKKQYSQRVQEYIRNNDFDKLNGWLKFRCAVFHKMWIKFFCVLKPGFLVVYKNQNMQRRVGWVGTILLSSVYIIERPTQREGFCFKLIHCLNKSLWVNKGPKKLQPVGNLKGLNLPLTSVIIRADNENVGKQWLEAMKSMCASFFYDVIPPVTDSAVIDDYSVRSSPSQSSSGEEETEPSGGEGRDTMPATNQQEEVEIDASACSVQIHEETMYVKDQEEPLPHLNALSKSAGNQIGNGKLDILLGLARQIKPNQPLSRIVIPPFVNYPRSFLDKLQDMFYRVDLIADMSKAPTPKERMEIFAKFMLWLQNFHPTREMKKYYNSVLGEKSRCYFQHPNGSRTHFIAEEVTHHPPASAIYCVNKQEGFHIKVLMEFEIRFHGYYVRTNVRGRLEATLENLGEVYTASFPDLMVLNIFIGQFRIDFEGPCTLKCEQTGYTCQIENKTRWSPWGRESQFHRIRARLYDENKQELLQAEGHWNSAVYTKSANNQSKEKEKLFWKIDKSELLEKHIVHQSDLAENESSRLWCGLTEALLRGDEEDAILQKTVVEQRQRDLRATREQMGVVYQPALMDEDENDPSDTKIFNYKHHSDTLWDPNLDEYQYEHNFVIKTHRKGNLPSIESCGGFPVLVDLTMDSETHEFGSKPGLSRTVKQPSREVVYSETIKEQGFENSMQLQMNMIQKDLKTLHEQLRTMRNEAADAAGSRKKIVNERIVERPQPRTSSSGLSCSSILFCIFFVIVCALYTYYRNNIAIS
ncbi:oxysterol-binding protein-related protein 8-like isoform X3 [Convolutriloba macropyga]